MVEARQTCFFGGRVGAHTINYRHSLYSLVGAIYASASDIHIGGENYFQYNSAAQDDGGEIVHVGHRVVYLQAFLDRRLHIDVERESCLLWEGALSILVSLDRWFHIAFATDHRYSVRGRTIPTARCRAL